MSTMGMQVELSMTAKGVQATLKDAQGAIVQTASIIKTQLPQATDAASKGLSQFKEGLGRSRETMMFFTQALGELGPGGRTAQMALSGLGSMFMGGGVVGLGLAAAQVGTRLLTEYLGKEAAAAEEAKKKNDQVFEKLKTDAEAAGKAVQDFNAKARGISGEDSGLAANAAAMNPHIAKAKAEADAKRAILAGLQGQQDSGRAYIGQQDEIDAAKEAVRVADAAHADLLAKQKAFEDRRGQIAMASAVEIENARRAADDDAERERNQKAIEAAKRAAEERARIGAADNAASWKLQEEEAARLTALEKEREAANRAENDFAWQLEVQKAGRLTQLEEQANTKRIAQYQQVGEALGNVMGGLITGQMSLGQAIAQVGQMVIQSVVQTAIASVTAKAADAAAGAAASQSAIPVFGPVLAITAMGAMMSMVLGLLSNMPSAAGGWERVPNDTMAMIHKDEQVLPARYAEGLRSLVEGGGSGGITVNISTPDAAGVRRLFLDNTSALAEAIGRAARDGRRFG